MYRFSILAVSIATVGCADNGMNESASLGGSIGSSATASASDTDDESDDGEEQGDESSSSTTADSDSMTGESSSEGAEESTSTGAPACEQEGFAFELVPTPPNVMLVLDKSRSMSNLWDHDANPATAEISRWNSLHNVVEFVTGEFSDSINFGAQLFPAADAYLDEPVNAYSCLVQDHPEVTVGTNTGAAILAAIPAAGDFSISGGTPATAGLTRAIEHLQTLPSDEPRAILLITDGAANCSSSEAPGDTLFVYDDAVPALVADAWGSDAIPTYVVGINILDELGTKPAVNPYEALSTVADAGGVPATGVDRFYNAFNEIELAAALEVVANRIECTLTLPEEPQFPDHVDVTVEGQPWGAVADCETGNGWTYTNAMGPFNAIQLCGGACEALQGGATVDVEYQCP
ncbi:MAG TPA: hypothetical protein VG755_08355 [Nannocystaceae bacterium]|nr:hypothetical protein [Nannocystaceae bacterium]